MKNSWCILLCFCFNSSFGQSVGAQVWGEYFLNFPFATVYNMEYNGTYSTVFGSPKWRAIDNSFTVERAFGAYMDVSLTGLVSYTDQTDTYSTLELRPTLGIHYHIIPHRRVSTRLFVRYEQRHVKDLEDEEWTQTNRIRIRPELLIPFNRKLFSADKLWYGMVDVEWFATLDGDQEERFANRFRTRMGVGYRLNYSLRFEFVYVLQQSKDTIDEEFKHADSIFRIRLKQYLRKGKPIKHTLDGDN